MPECLAPAKRVWHRRRCLTRYAKGSGTSEGVSPAVPKCLAPVKSVWHRKRCLAPEKVWHYMRKPRIARMSKQNLHYERSEAIQLSGCSSGYCFATLVMTWAASTT
jgi:hypothetical protein